MHQIGISCTFLALYARSGRREPPPSGGLSLHKFFLDLTYYPKYVIIVVGGDIMKFRDLSSIIATDVFVEAYVIDGKTYKVLNEFKFYAHEYGDDDALCRKLDRLDVHHVRPARHNELDVILLGGE